MVQHTDTEPQPLPSSFLLFPSLLSVSCRTGCVWWGGGLKGRQRALRNGMGLSSHTGGSPRRLSPSGRVCPTLTSCIFLQSMSKVWYKQDDTFFLPKSCLCFHLFTYVCSHTHTHARTHTRSPLAYQDPTSTLLTSLFTRLLVDALNDYAYNAEIAGIQYRIKLGFYGLIVSFQFQFSLPHTHTHTHTLPLQMSVSGYRHKQSLLLSRMVEKMAQFEVDPKRFEVHKETLTRQLKNFHAKQPYRCCGMCVCVHKDAILFSS